MLSGISSSPSECAISVTLTMLRPSIATLRPNSCDRSRISWMRWIDELKQETTSRFSARLKMSSKRGRTARSDSV